MVQNMKIGVYYYRETNKDNTKYLLEEAKKRGLEIDNDNPDIVFPIGGDGTFLRAIHHYLNSLDKIIFVGVHYGTLGFFYDFTENDIPALLDEIVNKEYVVKEHALLKGDVKYKGEEDTIYAVNEIRIENPFHTLISDVYIEDEKLETFRGNGLVVASSLGSSAYNKSLGGSLVDHDIDSLQLTEIAPIANNVYRSLGSSFVLSKDKHISFSGSFKGAVVGYDHSNIENKELISIKISCSDKKVKILHSKDQSFIKRIRKSFIL